MVKAQRLGSIDKGLFIVEDASSSLVEKKYIRYKKGDLAIYRDKFIDLIGERIIREDCSFEDHVWIGYGNYHYETFDFTEIEYNQNLYLSLKCYIVLRLFDHNLVVNTVHQELNYILKVIRMTGAYDKRFLKDFTEFIRLKDLESKKSTSHIKQPNLSYIYFNPLNDSKFFVEELLKIKETPGISNHEHNVREIPTYSNFILFDEKIHDFMLNTTPYLRERYYPIFIWWRLTSVIPIRPIEFVEILNDGICYKPEEDAYFILIPRRKQKPDPMNKKHQAILQELKISKEMYNIICDFRKIAKIEQEKYLFPVSFYRKFLLKEKISYKLLHYTTHMNWGQMNNLLDNFFNEVINSKYGIKVVQKRDELDRDNEHKTIKRFNLGDTRHMSICMMMMQGFSELTIAQMAGHTNIRTQSHYSSHIDDFERSYSGLLQKDILGKMNIGDKSGFDSFTFRQKQLLSYAFKEIANPRKIDYGECHSKNFPTECFSKDCIFCNKFKIDLTKLTTKEKDELNNKITVIKDEIQVKLNFIKKYYRTAFKRADASINKNENDKVDLERNVMNLDLLINRKAKLEAYFKKSKEVY